MHHDATMIGTTHTTSVVWPLMARTASGAAPKAAHVVAVVGEGGAAGIGGVDVGGGAPAAVAGIVRGWAAGGVGPITDIV